MKRLLVSLIIVLSLALPAAAQVVEDPSTGASISSGSTISGCNAITAILNVVTGALTCNPASVVNGTVSTAGRSILTIQDTISGSSATSNFLNITGTFPATLSAITNGINFVVAGDNDAQQQSALQVTLSGASTGVNAAIRGTNTSTGAVSNYGIIGEATGAGARSIGVWGVASGGNNQGGFFSLGSAAPQSQSYALGADNGAVASPIFVGMDNGTAVFTIADGGAITATSNLTLSSGSLTAGGGVCSISASTGLLICYGPGAFAFDSAGSVTSGSTGDTFIRRDSAAAIQLGTDVNGAPVNQTFKAHDGITGTDVKGASLTLAPGLGTGAAVSNPLTLNRVVTKATGTTAQTYSPAYITCPTKILSNTSATAQTIATITTTSTTGGSVTIDYTTVANNGTLQDTDSGMVKVSWNNNAGTVAAAMTAVALQSDSDASGTLATTPTATVATNVVSIKFTPTWVTIVPTTVTGWATFTLHTSGDTVVCQ